MLRDDYVRLSGYEKVALHLANILSFLPLFLVWFYLFAPPSMSFRFAPLDQRAPPASCSCLQRFWCSSALEHDNRSRRHRQLPAALAADTRRQPLGWIPHVDVGRQGCDYSGPSV